MELVKNDVEITSLQIAEMTGKEHHNILKSIRKMMESVTESDAVTFNAVTYLDSHGESRPMIVMNKWATLYIASKFNDKIRLSLVNRVVELEESIKTSVSKEVIEQFVPKTGYMEENKKGMLRFKPISGYWKSDASTEVGRIIQRIHELQKHVHGLFPEEMKEEIRLAKVEIEGVREKERLKLTNKK